MARRGENIYKRKDGRWEARIIFDYTSEGKACYRYLYGKTYQEAKNKKNKLLAELQNSTMTRNFQRNYLKITLDEVMQECFESRKDSLKESTYMTYVCLYERHLKPDLGSCRMTALTTDRIDAYLKEKLKSGRLDHKGGLSPKTVADIRSILLMALKFARKKKYPCADSGDIFYPSMHSQGIQVLSKLEQQKLEETVFAANDSLSSGILLALYSGLRIGEICALQWKDINFEEQNLLISKTIIRIRNLDSDSKRKTKVIIDRPKTDTSIRTIPLPAFLIEYLETFRKEDNTYLLTGTTHFMEPRIYLRKYKQILNDARLEDYTFHCLRHTFATRCVENGFDVKALSEILGHANVSTTLQRYVHPSMDSKREQIERLASSSICRQNKPSNY
nr:site-specific integrase [uncultured Anaerostipes sp.]